MLLFYFTDIKAPARKRIPIDLHRAACNPLTPNILPSRLRPIPKPSVIKEIPQRLTGNIVADVTKCEHHFNSCIRQHLKEYPECNGDVVFDPEAFSKWGLAFSDHLKCSAGCGYRSASKLKFYTEVEREGTGRRAAKTNVQLQVILTKHPIGNAAVRELLASIDVHVPCESGMQRAANKVSDKFHELAEEQLKENRKLVRTVMRLRSEDAAPSDEIPLVRAQSDVAYNNPPKGRAFYQPGTQAWAPCFVAEPGLENVPIAFRTRSKVCSCVSEGYEKQHKPSCKLNFPPDQAMGNAEHELGKDLAKQLLQDNESALGVKTLITDGDSHLQLGMHSEMEKRGIRVEKGDCTRHTTRSVSRNLRRVKLSIGCTGGPGKTVAERVQNQGKLATFIERRSTHEFRAIHRKYVRHHEDHLEQLIEAGHLAKIGILGCIQGHTDVCRQASLTCGSHRDKSNCKVSFPYHAYTCIRYLTHIY